MSDEYTSFFCEVCQSETSNYVSCLYSGSTKLTCKKCGQVYDVKLLPVNVSDLPSGKISEVVKRLNEIKQLHGDIVIIQNDSELGENIITRITTDSEKVYIS